MQRTRNDQGNGKKKREENALCLLMLRLCIEETCLASVERRREKAILDRFFVGYVFQINSRRFVHVHRMQSNIGTRNVAQLELF